MPYSKTTKNTRFVMASDIAQDKYQQSLERAKLDRLPRNRGVPKPRGVSSPSRQVPKPDESRPLRRTEKTDRLTIYIPSDVAMKLRVYCAVNRCTQSDKVTEALRAWIVEKDKKDT